MKKRLIQSHSWNGSKIQKRSVIGKANLNKIREKQVLLHILRLFIRFAYKCKTRKKPYWFCLKDKGGFSLATRQSVEEHIQQCEDAIRNAQEQFNKASMQEHYDDESFTNSMQQLEQAFNDISKLALSCNGQQREQLHRMRLQLQQVQNNMILLDH